MRVCGAPLSLMWFMYGRGTREKWAMGSRRMALELSWRWSSANRDTRIRRWRHLPALHVSITHEIVARVKEKRDAHASH